MSSLLLFFKSWSRFKLFLKIYPKTLRPGSEALAWATTGPGPGRIFFQRQFEHRPFPIQKFGTGFLFQNILRMGPGRCSKMSGAHFSMFHLVIGDARCYVSKLTSLNRFVVQISVGLELRQRSLCIPRLREESWVECTDIVRNLLQYAGNPQA